MAKVQQVYRKLAIHSRTIFSNFSLFWATIFQIHEVKSATIFQGRPYLSLRYSLLARMLTAFVNVPNQVLQEEIKKFF